MSTSSITPPHRINKEHPTNPSPTDPAGAPGQSRHTCPFHASCGMGPFNRASEVKDHLNEKHNRVPREWRGLVNKQKRRKPEFLTKDYTSEAKALNSAMKRALVAESVWKKRAAAVQAEQKKKVAGEYQSRHGLDLTERFQQVSPRRFLCFCLPTTYTHMIPLSSEHQTLTVNSSHSKVRSTLAAPRPP